MTFPEKLVDICVILKGYETVIVNGSIVYNTNGYTDVRSGQIV